MDIVQVNEQLRPYGIQFICENCSSRARRISKRRSPRSAVKSSGPGLLARLTRSAREPRGPRRDDLSSPLRPLGRVSFLNELTLPQGTFAPTPLAVSELSVSPFVPRRLRLEAPTPELVLLSTPGPNENRRLKSPLQLTPIGPGFSMEDLGLPGRHISFGLPRTLDFEKSLDNTADNVEWPALEIPRFL